MNTSESQNVNIIGGNIQTGIPTQQADPTQIINTHYLPNGDLTIQSDQDLDTWTINKITIPISTVAGLFQNTTDSTEQNIVIDDDIELSPPYYTPRSQTSMPNIAQFIGALITGTDLDQRYLESILICTSSYLDGTMEILPSGMFLMLNARRDGTNRRYSQLCMILNYAISYCIYTPPPPRSDVAMEQQALIQTLFVPGATSMLTKLRQATVNSENYTITKTMLNRWAMTTPWHALIYNSQAPLTRNAFIKLFYNIYTINCGKRITYTNSVSGFQPTMSIVPNSGLFTKLDPINSVSSTYNINTQISQRLSIFIRYMLLSSETPLTWITDDDESDNDSVSTLSDTSFEPEVDDSELASQF